MLKILIVEDNKDILDVLEIILVEDGYEVISCTDGSCLDKLAAINPKLILMDELLPKVKGSDLCRKLKSNTEFKHIPVVLISAAHGIEHIASKCGADAFVEKPFNIARLIELVRSLIH